MPFNADGSRVYNTTLPTYNTNPTTYNTTTPQYAGAQAQQQPAWVKPAAPVAPAGMPAFNEQKEYQTALTNALKNNTYTNPVDIYKQIYAKRESGIGAYIRAKAEAEASGDGDFSSNF